MKPPVVTPLADTEIEWGSTLIPAPTEPSFEPEEGRLEAFPETGNGHGRHRFHGTNPVPPDDGACEEDPFRLTPIGELLAEPDDAVTYIVEGLIQKASVNVLAAKPKVGKSTLARVLALAVARGEDVIGRRCPEAGTVWYLAFEGNRADIKRHFRQLGATAADPLQVFIGKAPDQIIAKVRARAVNENPDLIIVDTMQRFLRAKCTDDYAEMTLLFDHVIGIAQQSGAAVLLVTHNSKIEREGLDSILGSTAIAGSVDTAILLKRTDRYRTIATVQRTGEDLGETLLVLNESGRVHLGGSRHLADQDFLRRQLYEALEKAGPLKQTDLLDRVEARRTAKLAALKDLTSGNYGNHRNQTVEVTGSGKAHDPYVYSLAPMVSGSVVPLRGGNQTFKTPVSGDLLRDSAQMSSSHLCTGPEPDSNGDFEPGTREPETDDDVVF